MTSYIYVIGCKGTKKNVYVQDKLVFFAKGDIFWSNSSQLVHIHELIIVEEDIDGYEQTAH